jgi:hypothetical protein
MELHQRGVDLLLNVMDSADHVEQLSPNDMRRLLTEVAQVVSLILERDAKIALKQKRRYTAQRLRARRNSYPAHP